MLKCGVIVPFGVNLMSFDTKQLKGLSQSLEILTYMREGVKRFELLCGKSFSFIDILVYFYMQPTLHCVWGFRN